MTCSRPMDMAEGGTGGTLTDGGSGGEHSSSGVPTQLLAALVFLLRFKTLGQAQGLAEAGNPWSLYIFSNLQMATRSCS